MSDNFLSFITLGMGNTKSKRKDKHGSSKGSSSFVSGNRDTHGGTEATRDHDFSVEINERWAEDEELKRISQNIAEKPQMFILNNLMMCVQFFENYDEEISNIRKTLVSSRETELNTHLPPQKHILIPDVLQQHVAQKVDFTYMLPTLKHTIELLQPIRIYVVFDNIEVSEENYPSPYCSVNETITYSMQLKPSPGRKGYVQLQRLEVNPPKRTASADELRLPSVANGTREVYSDGDSIYGSKLGKNSGAITLGTKNVRDLNNDESVYGDNRYGSRGNNIECPITNGVDEDNACGPSINGRTIRDDSTMARKVDTRRVRPRNPGRQYGKTKLPCSANESPACSTSSGYKSENYMGIDSDYSYAQTSYSNTPKTSKSSLDDDTANILSMEIPRQCFKKMEYRADGKIYDPRRERKQKMSTQEQLIWQAHQRRNYDVWYLNSTNFMKYFCHIFTQQLAIPMGFHPDITEKIQGSVIYRDKVEIVEGTMSTKLETFEIVPCVSSPWPECAQEWLDRPRTSWPQCDIIEKVKEFGCHMIPEGSVIDKPIGNYKDLDWQLIFPAAERFLETCLTYPQVRVYLISLMLHKTFIRPVDSIFGLTTSHIKNRLFWLVEEDDRPAKWMENRTGESLMRLLNSLYRSIRQDEPNLPDFFVKDKNLFQDKSNLLRTQKQLNRIIENPVMYVFHAMENIRHSRTFFPRLNYEELLRILTADSLTLDNRALVPQNTKSVGSAYSSEKDYDQVGGFWDNVKQKNNEKAKVIPKKQVTNRSLINPRKASDDVVEIPIRCASMDSRRLSSLLNFFIKHFIKMAECCHKYGAIPQKTAYVEQAERLSVLLSKHGKHKDNAKGYLEKLCLLKRRTANSRSQSEPPEPPRRNRDMPLFTRAMNDPHTSTEFQEENFTVAPSNEESEQHETHDIRPIIRVMVHEANTEPSENVKLRSSDDVTITERETVRNKRTARVVSLTDKSEESHLTETTYI